MLAYFFFYKKLIFMYQNVSSNFSHFENLEKNKSRGMIWSLCLMIILAEYERGIHVNSRNHGTAKQFAKQHNSFQHQWWCTRHWRAKAPRVSCVVSTHEMQSPKRTLSKFYLCVVAFFLSFLPLSFCNDIPMGHLLSSFSFLANLPISHVLSLF